MDVEMAPNFFDLLMIGSLSEGSNTQDTVERVDRIPSQYKSVLFGNLETQIC